MRLFVPLADPVLLDHVGELPIRRQWQAVMVDESGEEHPGVLIDVDAWRTEVQALDALMTGCEQPSVRVPLMVHVRRDWVAHAEHFVRVP